MAAGGGTPPAGAARFFLTPGSFASAAPGGRSFDEALAAGGCASGTALAAGFTPLGIAALGRENAASRATGACTRGTTCNER